MIKKEMGIIAFIKKRKWWLIILIVVIGGGYLMFRGGEEESRYQTYKVTRQTVEQTVEVTGRVIASSEVSLAFDGSGIITGIMTDVGWGVFPGQELAQIDDSELKADLSKKEANLLAQEAQLDQLYEGTREEEVQVAENDLNNAYLTVPDILNDAKNTIEDALYKQVDPIFSSDDTDPELVFSVSGTQEETNAEAGRLIVLNNLNSLRSDISNLDKNDRDNLEVALENTKVNLEAVDSFLAKALAAVNAAVNLSNTNETTYKTNINTARTAVQTVIESITAQQKTISTEKRDLDLKLAGTREGDLKYQQAQVDQARADVITAESKLSKTIIKSPIYGVVTAKNVQLGEFVSAGTKVLDISGSRLEIESFVPEADIAKIKVGDKAKVTLDAFGSDIYFEAKVIKINPAETVIEGVATYKITCAFTSEDDNVKSGMTANIDLFTNIKENVLAVPYRAINRRNGDVYVRMAPVDNETEPVERDIKSGLRGSEGYIEILEGLSEGEEIITFDKN